jgi:hypothetical protein
MENKGLVSRTGPRITGDSRKPYNQDMHNSIVINKNGSIAHRWALGGFF